jgi:hypothetical protein
MSKFWDTQTNKTKPTGIKDPDAILDYPIDYSAWLLDLNDTYYAHTTSVTGGITVDASSYLGGCIIPMISGGNVGETASFTIHIITTGGREDDRTFWLNIVER